MYYKQNILMSEVSSPGYQTDLRINIIFCTTIKSKLQHCTRKIRLYKTIQQDWSHVCD